MLFLVLENQLFLIISLFFSACLFLNSIALKSQPVKSRAFGLAFAIPFILNTTAFLTSPYQKSSSAKIFLFGQLLLILACTIIVLVKEDSSILKLFYVLPFILVWAACIFSSSDLYSSCYWSFYFVDIALILVNLVLVFNSMFQKKKQVIPAHIGLFMMSASLGIWLLSDALTIEAVIIAGMGYGLCTLYYYRNIKQPRF